MSEDVHGGNVWRWAEELGSGVDELVDFSASINPLGLPPGLEEAIHRELPALVHYPDPHCCRLREQLARRHGLSPRNILVGNGATELIHLLPRALKPRAGLIPTPCFSEYGRALCLSGGRPLYRNFGEEEEEGFRFRPASLDPDLPGTDLLFLGHPNNPTGFLSPREDLMELVDRCADKGVWVVADEAFIDFLEEVEDFTLINEVPRRENLLVLRSFTKFYAIPGLRLGYLAGPEALVARLETAKEPWTVNVLAQAVGLELCRESPVLQDYVRRSRQLIRQERGFLTRALDEIEGLQPFPSRVNFLLVKVTSSRTDAPTLARRLAPKGLLVRDCSRMPGLDARYFRVAVRTREENLRLIESLRGAMGEA